MKIAVYKQSGEKLKDMTVSTVFDSKVSAKAVTLYINYLRAALRAPIANTKDRGAVSGGGKKPWRQKGTGNARAGSNRSPLWVGGGVTFGPSSERNFRKRINSKEKKRVILGIFADLFADNKIVAVENLSLEEIKTKKAFEIINNVKAEGKIALIVGKEDVNAAISFRNLAGIKVMTPSMLDPIYLLSSDKVIMSTEALAKVESLYNIKKVEKEIKEEVKSDTNE